MGSRVLTAENLNIEFHRDRLIWKALVHYGLHHGDSAKALGLTEKGLQLILDKKPNLWKSAQYTCIELNIDIRKGKASMFGKRKSPLSAKQR